MRLILNPQNIDSYWKLRDVEFFKLLQQVSSLEKWTLSDDPSFQVKIEGWLQVCKHWKNIDYVKNSDEITQLMMYMNISKFAYLLHYFDDSFPGTSFHYVMEARHKQDWEAGQLLIQRLRLINDHGYLKNIFAPMRVRLIQGLLEDYDDECEID